MNINLKYKIIRSKTFLLFQFVKLFLKFILSLLLWKSISATKEKYEAKENIFKNLE